MLNHNNKLITECIFSCSGMSVPPSVIIHVASSKCAMHIFGLKILINSHLTQNYIEEGFVNI